MEIVRINDELSDTRLFGIQGVTDDSDMARVEGLNKFRTEDQKCPALVCTDLAARGLDLVVDHVIMFDFPLNSIDYLHRTGRTARMGARGKVTSLVSKKSLALAELIEEAIHKGETLESVSLVRKDAPEMRKQPVKAKTMEKGTPKRQASSLRGKPSKKNLSARPTSEIAKPTARGTKLVLSKAKGPVVRVGLIQKGNKRIGQKVAGKR
ncbi:hypothetical protein L7F22_041094 [Adiantum nelumboides]|nr:hypothetical protein [Adiantum nelumboides]